MQERWTTHTFGAMFAVGKLMGYIIIFNIAYVIIMSGHYTTHTQYLPYY